MRPKGSRLAVATVGIISMVGSQLAFIIWVAGTSNLMALVIIIAVYSGGTYLWGKNTFPQIQ